MSREFLSEENGRKFDESVREINVLIDKHVYVYSS